MAFTWKAINKSDKIEFKELNDLRYAADWLNDNPPCPANNGAVDSAPQYLTNDASPQYVGVDSAPQYTGRDNAPQNNSNNGTHNSSVTSDRRQKRDIVYL